MTDRQGEAVAVFAGLIRLGAGIGQHAVHALQLIIGFGLLAQQHADLSAVLAGLLQAAHGLVVMVRGSFNGRNQVARHPPTQEKSGGHRQKQPHLKANPNRQEHHKPQGSRADHHGPAHPHHHLGHQRQGRQRQQHLRPLVQPVSPQNGRGHAHKPHRLGGGKSARQQPQRHHHGEQHHPAQQPQAGAENLRPRQGGDEVPGQVHPAHGPDHLAGVGFKQFARGCVLSKQMDERPQQTGNHVTILS